ncbi:MAG: hypothetical protein ACAI44_24405 [Candidatus Sericytochromatia bacterium]
MLKQLHQLSQLKDLDSTQAQLQQRDSQRHSAAQTLYAQAQDLLRTYNHSLDKQTLKQCMLVLTECIRASRSYPEPYLLLSYIYLALRLPQLALRYLRVVDHLQPKHPLLPKLKQAISEGFQAPVVRRMNPRGSRDDGFALLDLESVDYDALYDEVDAQIAREIEATMNIPMPVRPTASEALIAELQGYRTNLEQNLNLISGQLDVLDQEIDCARLRSKVRLIETRWRQLLAMEEHSRQFLELGQRLRSAQADVWVEMAADEPSEASLERFLDQCDAFADLLDELSGKGLDISELEGEYSLLTDNITQLQERLDS